MSLIDSEFHLVQPSTKVFSFVYTPDLVQNVIFLKPCYLKGVDIR